MITNFISSENGLKSGGTISGDVTIDGDLTVNGDGLGNYDEIVNGNFEISGEIRLNDRDGDGTFGGRIRYDNSENSLRIEANEVSGDDIIIKSNDAISFEDASSYLMILDGNKMQIGNESDGNIDSPLHILVSGGGSGNLLNGIKIEDPAIANTEHLGILFSGRTDNPGGKAYMGAVRADNFGVMDLVFYTDSAADDGSVTVHDNVMTFTHDGNLGIGDSSPDGKLSIYGDSNAAVNLVLTAFSTNEGKVPRIQLRHSNNDTVGTNSAVGSGDDLGEIAFQGYDGSSEYNTGASILAEAGATFTTSESRTDLMFKVASGSKDPAEKLRLGHDGVLYVGGYSGLAAPELVIKSNTTGNGLVNVVSFRDSANAQQGYLGYGSSSHGNLNLYNALGGLNFYAGSANIRFALDDNSRISLSNNDDGQSNTIFGKNCAINLDSGSDYNVFIGENVSDASMDNATKNVGIGYNTLSSLTTGDSNVAIGYEAHKNNSSGGSNVVIGANAGDAMSNSSSNVVIGSFALTDADSGESNNVIIGANAGKDMDSSSNDDNVVIGKDAGMGSLDQCVAIGKGALQSTGGSDITESLGTVAIGTLSCEDLTTGTGTTAVGHESCMNINVGDQNTAFGYQALKSATTGEYNVAVGYQALLDNVDGSHNTAVGRLALENFEPTNPNEGHNSALGSLAGNDINTGTNNTCIGSNAGHDNVSVNLTTGSQNTFLGSYTNGSATNASNQTVIGYEADGTGNNEIALGNTSVSAIKAQVSSITPYSSDERTKKDVADYDLKGVDFIKELKLKTYLYKNPADFPDEIRHSKWDAKDEDGNLIHERPSDPTETQVGLIAQEVEAALAKHGVGNVETYAPTQDSGIKTLTYGNLIFPLIKAVQELSARVEELESK